MSATSKETEQRAARNAMKEERARDAALAWKDWEAEKLAVRAKTARLRALRLAKEAENELEKKIKKPAKAKVKAKKDR